MGVGLADEPIADTAGVEAVAEAFVMANVWMARAHAGLAQLAADDVWADDGSISVTAWLRGRVGLGDVEARRAVRLARLIADAPTFSAAWQEGDLTAGQVAAIRANVDDATQPLFAEHEADLVPTLVPLTVTETTRAMRTWKAHADALVDRPEPAEQIGVVHHRQLLDGTWHLDGTLGLEAGAVVEHALRLAAERADGVGDVAGTPGERRAEALVEVCQQFLVRHPGGRAAVVRGRRRRPHLHVVLDAAALVDGGRGRLAGGGVLPRSATERLLCDAQLHRLVLGPRGELLDLGRATRTVSGGLWSALVLRDGGCRHPGCDRPVAWTDAHHVVPFARGGRTALANLVLLCRRHHTRLHQPGWQLHLDPDGSVHVTDPAGRTHVGRPPGCAPP